MNTTFTCDDKATLVAYIYCEVDAPTRQAVDDHLAQCPACAAEVTALGGVRSELGVWAPPEVELDFQIVKKSDLPPSNVLRPAQWWNTVPVWVQAAAAILVLAAGLSIANVRISSGAQGFQVTTGWMNAAGPALSEPFDGKAVEQRVERALVSLEKQLQSEIRAAREQDVRAAPAGAVDEATVRRVQQLLAASEQRHQRELAVRFVELTRDMNVQRRADLQNIGRYVGQYDEQLLRQRQILNDQGRALNSVIRISSTPQQ